MSSILGRFVLQRRRERGVSDAGLVARSRAWAIDLSAVGLLLLAALGFFWRMATGQNWMPADGGDLVSFLYPTYRFAAAALRDGIWPLWNPHLYTGAPHVADIQAGFLYPPNLLLFLAQPEFPYRALQWMSLAHIWFAGAGMYFFLARGLGLQRAPALAGALAFMFSDAFIVHFGNLNFNAVASWTPWVFWAYAAGLDRLVPAVAHDLRSEHSKPEGMNHRYLAAVAGGLLALATLAGHIQATLFILLALAFYTLFWLWLQRADPDAGGRARAAAGQGSITLLVTVLLAAPVLLPALQLTQYTARAEWNYQEAAGYSLSPAQWIGWLIPGFFGRGPQFHWGVWPRVEAGYLGILPLVLACLAIGLRRNRQTWVWVALAAVTFLLALGVYAIPHGWLTLLPGFGQLRAPARFVFITDFSVAILAAIGLHAVLQPLDKWARVQLDKVWRLTAYATTAVLVVGVPLAYQTLLLVQDRDPAVVTRVSITLIAVMTFAGLLLASLLWLTALKGSWTRGGALGWLAVGLIFLDLASTGAYQDLGNEDPSLSFQQPEIAGFLAGEREAFRIDTRTGIDTLWQPNTALLYGLDDVHGLANPLLLVDTARYWEGLNSRSSRLYDLLNVRYVIASKGVSLDWDKFVLAFDGDPELNVYLNREALPRAFIVPNARAVASHEAAWDAIHAEDFSPELEAIIEDAPASLAMGGKGEVSELRTDAGRVMMRATLDAPGLLVISQAWYPGWQVWVDGSLLGAPIRTNYAFQGVPLTEGAHEVRLVFVPPLWRIGWILAGATTLLLFFSSAVIVWRRMRAAKYSVGRKHGD